MKEILITIVFVIVFIKLFDFIVGRIINIIQLLRKGGEYHEGMIFNPENNKLEADNFKITLF